MLVALSVIEQRYRAVMAVLDGARVSEVAAEVGVSRQSLHAWLARYREAGLAGLADRSSRPRSSPNRASPAVEARVCELRRAHPKWGAQRIVHELMRAPAPPEPLPSRATVHRILVRHGLVIGAAAAPQARRTMCAGSGRRRCSCGSSTSSMGRGWSTPRTGELREARIVTGVDDHSRFCVLARVVERATGRAICLAFAEALERYGAPEEVLTDNGKQFTARFGRGGEVLFDKICRRNGIAHRLTQPARRPRPARSSASIRRCGANCSTTRRPFTSLLEAQAALDDWVREYNAERPHQALETSAPVTPSERFQPASDEQRELLGLWLPAALAPCRGRQRTAAVERALDAGAAPEAVEPAGRSSSIASSRRRATCGSRAGSSGSGPPAPGRRCASGPASTSSTSRSPAPASRACARTVSTADLAQLAREGADSGRPAAAARRRAR